MKERWIKLKEWWSTLASREKKAIAIGASLLGIVIVYQGMWMPLLHLANNERQLIKDNQKLLAWMQTTDKKIAALSTESTSIKKSLSPALLLDYLQKQVNQSGLEKSLVQLKQGSNNSIEMHFQKVEFDRLIRLLMATSKEQSISIEQLSVVAVDTLGMVNVDVGLKLVQ